MNILVENLARQLQEFQDEYWTRVVNRKEDGWERFVPIAEYLAQVSRIVIGDEIDWHSSSVFQGKFDESDIKEWEIRNNFANGLIVAAKVARGEIDSKMVYQKEEEEEEK
jgi:hypothetical protein